MKLRGILFNGGTMRKCIMFILAGVFCLLAETLFEVKDASNNKVLDISTDGLRVLNGGDTLMVISTDGIRAYIQNDATKGLSRTFSVTTNAAKGEKSQNKVFEVATDDGATFYNPTDNADEIFSISKSGITANVNPGTGRDFEVNDQVSAAKAGAGNLMKISNKPTFETVNDSTMLWYKQKNAFRVGHVLITDPNNVGQASFASGSNQIASGQASFPSGSDNTASGKFSAALGYHNTASGYISSALGYGNTASDFCSAAIGHSCTSSKDYSFASGDRTASTGIASTAMGMLTTASQNYATSLGYHTTASGLSALATGHYSKASGYYSTAFGYYTEATGVFSNASGYYTISPGVYSSANGKNTRSQSFCSFAVGRYNLDEGDSANWVETDPLFTVGNGTGSLNRSNAFEVKKNGNTYVSGNLGVGVSPSSSYGLYSYHNIQAVRGYGYTTTGSTTYGVYGYGYGGSSLNYGVYGRAGGVGATNWAGYFSGNVRVVGTINPTKVDVKLDHPLDPENKYLSHSGVISDQMTSVYNGNVVLDGSGSAKVQLPEWFEAMNTDFKYQLTAIGAPGPNLYIARKVSGNSFEIAGGSSGMEVSWQITSVRNDNFAKSNPLEIESKKKADEIGYYLHPESFGLSEEKGIDYHVQKREEEERENK